MADQQRFSREHRLRKRGEYRRAYEQGRRAFGRWVVVFCRRREDDGPWRLGLTATRKAGGAVVRNRLRRLGREYFRRYAQTTPTGWDIVVNFRPIARQARSAELGEDLEQTLARLGMAAGAPEKMADPPC